MFSENYVSTKFHTFGRTSVSFELLTQQPLLLRIRVDGLTLLVRMRNRFADCLHYICHKVPRIRYFDMTFCQFCWLSRFLWLEVCPFAVFVLIVWAWFVRFCFTTLAVFTFWKISKVSWNILLILLKLLFFAILTVTFF